MPDSADKNPKLPCPLNDEMNENIISSESNKRRKTTQNSAIRIENMKVDRCLDVDYQKEAQLQNSDTTHNGSSISSNSSKSHATLPVSSGMTRDIRIIKLGEKQWMCDVCKCAVFENFIEACMHEIACKSMKAPTQYPENSIYSEPKGLHLMTQMTRQNSLSFGPQPASSNGNMVANNPLHFQGLPSIASFNASSRGRFSSIGALIPHFTVIPTALSAIAPKSTGQGNPSNPTSKGNIPEKTSPLVSSCISYIDAPSKQETFDDSTQILLSSNAMPSIRSESSATLASTENYKMIESVGDAMMTSGTYLFNSIDAKIDDCNMTQSSQSSLSITSCSSNSHEPESTNDSKVKSFDWSQVDISLVPNDKSVLSDYNYILTQNIELYQVTTSFNISDTMKIKKDELPATKVGLRCIHCSSDERQVTASSFFPSSISSMASGIGTIGSRHLIGGKCPCFPKDILLNLKEAKLTSQQQSRITGKMALDAYCKELTKKHKIFDHEVSLRGDIQFYLLFEI